MNANSTVRESRSTQPLDAANHPDALLRVETVIALTGMGRTKIYDLTKQGQFPAPAVRRPRFTRWKARDLAAWLQAQ